MIAISPETGPTRALLGDEARPNLTSGAGGFPHPLQKVLLIDSDDPVQRLSERGDHTWQMLGRQMAKGSTAILIWYLNIAKRRDPDVGEVGATCLGIRPGPVFDAAGRERTFAQDLFKVGGAITGRSSVICHAR